MSLATPPGAAPGPSMTVPKRLGVPQTPLGNASVPKPSGVGKVLPRKLAVAQFRGHAGVAPIALQAGPH